MPPIPEPQESLIRLRLEVRRFLAEQRAAGAFESTVDCWMTGVDLDFTRALVERGWVGMTIPTRYGGRGRTFAERFVVTEELLAAGAPVAAHWIADRQMAPSILKYGTPTQKEQLLPTIADGTCLWAIGMSEPDSGSDLASVRTRATRVDGGWRLTGTKVWTSGAHICQRLMTLARSEPVDPADRHAGLSQFIVDLAAPGVTVRPIVSMNGAHHFNEVILDDVHVADAMVFGQIGEGWTQVTSELSFERSGPERILSSLPVLQAYAGRGSEATSLGALVARTTGLHQMSEAVADALSKGEEATVAAAVVKVLGTATEGDIVDAADLLCGDDTDDAFAGMVAAGVDQRPGFTVRGGSSQVLHGVIARGLGMR